MSDTMTACYDYSMLALCLGMEAN